VNLYAESSAILAWLLDEPRAQEIRAPLREAELVLTSVLAFVECDRVLHRLVKAGKLGEVRAADERARLARASHHWMVLSMSAEIVDRARQPFVHEPIRTLDALHLASALFGRTAVAGLALLSLDRRIRENGRTLGFELVPQ
jgi:predicted nucleic acid-binding protein